ncbi:hypothetical protein BC828DRAFT_396688 [Blastocladiella britannica]|nr:hypothetical protein BC828DRAFT_396688 [Blastocladiella britannica]
MSAPSPTVPTPTTTTTTDRVQRVAIIGSGLAGITTAWLLSNPDTAHGQYEVTVYEAAPRIGMDAHAMDVPCECPACSSGASHKEALSHPEHVDERLDSPYRLVLRNYYPTVFSLYAHLGAKVVPAALSMNFTRLVPLSDGNKDVNNISAASTPAGIHHRMDPSPVYTDRYLTVFGKVLRIPGILSHPWAQWETLKVGRDRLRFVRTARHLRSTRALPKLASVTLGDWLDTQGYSHAFVHENLLPGLAVMLSASHAQCQCLPAAAVLDCYGRPGGLGGWSLVDGGVGVACEQLIAHIPKERRRFGCPVSRIESLGEGKGFVVHSIARGHDSAAESADEEDEGASPTGQTSHQFELVVLATPVSVASRLAASLAEGPHAIPTARDLATHLSALTYEPVTVTVHHDQSVLPARSPRGVNIAFSDKDTMVTVAVHHVRPMPRHVPPIYQTTNPMVPIDPATVYGTWTFPRARLTIQAQDALDRVYPMQGTGGLFVVGAPMYPGIPLLEGCVASAVDVAERLGVQRPWELQEGEYIGYQAAKDLVRGVGEEGVTAAFLRGDLAWAPAGSVFATKELSEDAESSGWWKVGGAVALGAFTAALLAHRLARK